VQVIEGGGRYSKKRTIESPWDSFRPSLRFPVLHFLSVLVSDCLFFFSCVSWRLWVGFVSSSLREQGEWRRSRIRGMPWCACDVGTITDNRA
jgi:hypothetical protein